MDEVFGNSSSETVVSNPDMDKGSDDQHLSDASEEDQQHTTDCSKQEENKISGGNASTSETSNDGEEMGTTPPETSATAEDSTADRSSLVEAHQTDPVAEFARVSVIKSVGSSLSYGTDDYVFKMPYPPSANIALLRHTQSAVVSRPAITENKRQRAHSTATPLQSSYSTAMPLQSAVTTQNNPYQNLPILSHPVYMNVPSRYPRSPSKDMCIIRSAPSTPNGSHKSVSPRVNSSYIQLWSGVRQKRNLSESDSDDSIDSRPSSAGYVRMSSPYVRSPGSSILSVLAHHLASKSGCDAKDIYCPFCPRPFSQECNLSHHIQAIHRHELQRVICGTEPVLIQHCPLCEGKFFNSEVLPSHLLEFHRAEIIELLDQHQFLVIDDNGVKCPFCVKKVPISKIGEDVLLYHLLQVHNFEYESLIHALFKPVPSKFKEEALSRISTEDLAQVFKPGVTSTPGLSFKFQNLSCQFESESTASCVKLNETWNSHCIDLKNLTQQQPPPIQKNRGILRSQTDLSRKPSVKRELRFSVPPVTKEEFFVPESPEVAPPSDIRSQVAHDEEFELDYFPRNNIPVRVDSLSSADFIELTHRSSRKRRKLGIGIKSKKNFKKKDKENRQSIENVLEGLKSVGCGKAITNQRIVTTTATRTFRKPKPVAPPKVPDSALSLRSSADNPQDINSRMLADGASKPSDMVGLSPFSTMRLYSPLRMFRCNRCRVKFCDNESLGTHIRCRHRGLLGFLRPQFGCGICEAKFYENKYLVKHCLQHHTSLLEIRSPNKRQITVYRLNSGTGTEN